jgi:hypothetical protein
MFLINVPKGQAYKYSSERCHLEKFSLKLHIASNTWSYIVNIKIPPFHTLFLHTAHLMVWTSAPYITTGALNSHSRWKELRMNIHNDINCKL